MRLPTFALLALLAVPCLADEVVLTSGGSIRGRIVSENEREVVIQTDAGEVKLARTKIREVIRSQGSKQPPRPAPAPSAAAARFGWSLPCELVVEEQDSIAGTLILRRRHRVRAWQEAPDDVRVQLRATEIVEIRGAVLTAAQASSAEATRFAFPYPVLRIGPSGELRELVDVRRLVPDWIDRIAALSAPEIRSGQMLLKEHLGPDVEALVLRNRVTDEWDAWVGAWADAASLSPGERREVPREVHVGDRSVRVKATLERLEAAPGGRARARRTTVVEGEAARAGWEEALTWMMPAGASRIPVQVYRDETVLEVESDLGTLLPASAQFVRHLRQQLAGQSSNTDERRTWTFQVQGR